MLHRMNAVRQGPTMPAASQVNILNLGTATVRVLKAEAGGVVSNCHKQLSETLGQPGGF